MAAEWNFSQVFGERLPGDHVEHVDIISAIEFESRGEYLATGDCGGRVVIFERTNGKDPPSRKVLENMDYPATVHPKYIYKTEFQSHEPEFDYLKSLEIEEKINKLRWCATPNNSLFVLSTNDRTIKLWKVLERKVKKVKEMVHVDLTPHVISEGALLAEKNFMAGQNETSVPNGYHIEWVNKNPMSTSPRSHEGPSKAFNSGEGVSSRCRRVFGHAHDYNINSISNNSDGETFISADDLRINLWNMEISNQCFNIIDMKPPDMEDLEVVLLHGRGQTGLPTWSESSIRFLVSHPHNESAAKRLSIRLHLDLGIARYYTYEVITSAEFHPAYCNLLAYSSSRGFIRLVDMRRSALCDQNARILQDHEAHGSRSFFTEIVASISDIKFAKDGRHILSRDYMNLKLWDLHMETSPVATFKIHEYLHPKLSDLYNSDSIFDKFDCGLSSDGRQFASGSYSNTFKIFSRDDGADEGIALEASRNPNRLSHVHNGSKTARLFTSFARRHNRQGYESPSSDTSNGIPCDLTSKLIHLAWHPTDNFIACAAANSLYMYHA